MSRSIRSFPREAVRCFSGCHMFFWSERSEFADGSAVSRPSPAGVRMLSDSTAAPLPPLPSTTTPFSPFVVGDGSNPTVLWATSRDTTRRGVMTQDEVWASTLRDERWSTPVRVWQSSPSIMVLAPWTVSALDRTSGAVVVFPAADGARGLSGGIALLRVIPQAGAPVGLEPDRSEQSLSPRSEWSAGASVGGRGRHRARRSRGHGRGVDDPRRAHRYPGRPVILSAAALQGGDGSDPQFYRASDGVHLVWREKRREDWPSDCAALMRCFRRRR